MSTPSDARITNLLVVYFLTSTAEPLIAFSTSLRPLGRDPAIILVVTVSVFETTSKGILTNVLSVSNPRLPAGVLQVIAMDSP